MTRGIAAMLGACLIWGFMPAIYKPLSAVASEEVLAHRVIWSLVFFAVLLAGQGRLAQVRQALASPRQIWWVGVAAAMISVNWFLLIFATALGRNTETSLGYYIYPLFAVALGWIVFGERMNRAQGLAVVLATLAVLVLTFGLGTPPWIALALAASFAYYGVIKKTIASDALVSVTSEMVVFLPFVAGLLIWVALREGLTFGTDLFYSVYMVIAGPLTAMPLILFSYAAKRVRMQTIGLMQYINPSLQFFCAVVLFSEPFSRWHLMAFTLIWAALVIYTATAWRQESVRRKEARTSSASSATVTKSSSDGSAKP